MHGLNLGRDHYRALAASMAALGAGTFTPVPPQTPYNRMRLHGRLTRGRPLRDGFRDKFVRKLLSSAR